MGKVEKSPNREFKFMLVLKSSKGFKADGTANCIVEMIHDPNK